MNITADVPTANGVARLPALNHRGGFQSKLIRVLVLDDNEDDFAFVKVLLGKSLTCKYELVWAPTEAAALEAMESADFDVGLFDYKLGGTTGLEILRALQNLR